MSVVEQTKNIIDVKEIVMAGEGGAPSVDLSGLLFMRNEAMALVEVIKVEQKASGKYPQYLEQGLIDSLETIEAAIEVDEGKLIINSLSDRLLAGQHDEGIRQYFDGRTLVVPTSKITAAQVLPFQELPGQFDPVVDVRIKSDSDPVGTFYAGPAQISEQPSSGRWHRFHLADTILSVAN